MEVPSRHRPLLLLAAVIVSQILLLAFQIKRDSHVRLIRVWSVELLTPLQRGGTFVISKIEGAWFGYLDLRDARAENRKLTAELDQLRLQNQQLQSQAAQDVRLARLLGFRSENAGIPMLAAEVIGANADPNSQTVFINRGTSDGIRHNMPVITPDGVVGRIFEAYPHTSQVLLISDRESALGALLSGTRTHGVVEGTGGPLLSLDYVSKHEDIPIGATVLTSGEDRIFPKDLPVGTIVSAKPDFPFQAIRLNPAAHLNRLEEVLVLLTQKPFPLRPENEAQSSRRNSKALAGRQTAYASPAAHPVAPPAPERSLASTKPKPKTKSPIPPSAKKPRALAPPSLPKSSGAASAARAPIQQPGSQKVSPAKPQKAPAAKTSQTLPSKPQQNPQGNPHK